MLLHLQVRFASFLAIPLLTNAFFRIELNKVNSQLPFSICKGFSLCASLTSFSLSVLRPSLTIVTNSGKLVASGR